MKRKIMITAPVTSRSGYGAHARDLCRSLIDHNKYDLFIEDVPWGNCPRNALDKNNPNDTKISDCFLNQNNKLNEQPDIYIDIRIPNEFRQLGKFNIGITAGTETDTVSGKWLDGCNKMNLIIVPSTHSMGGFTAVYDKMQPNKDGSQNKIGELKLERPMEVLFEGADEDIYKPLTKDEISTEFLDWLNDEVPERFAYLMVGQWTQGGYGEDRKDIGKTIKVFFESFANKKKQPALILKTNGPTFSILDKEEILSKIRYIKQGFKGVKLPNVYLLHGSLSDVEMNYLYNHPKVKCLVSLTHGEGFGRPLLEATMTGLPVIASNWSGQCDFLDTNHCLLLGGKLEPIPDSVVWEDVLIKDSKWFNVDEKNAYKAYNYVYENHSDAVSKAKKLMRMNRVKFSLKNMTEKLEVIMSKFIKLTELDKPKTVEIKLPKMKKTTIPLPKLKKIEKNTGVTTNE